MDNFERSDSRTLTSTSNFILIYVCAASLTYVLPYLGSNSSLLNAITLGFNPAFWMHMTASCVLVIITLLRGRLSGNEWIAIFPAGALLFDFAPILNWIPLVPSVFHLLALGFGLSSQKD